MTAPHAILLVPTEVGAALLAVGRCGARAPFVRRDRTDPVCANCGAVARWSPAPTDQTDSRYVCSVEWRHEGILYQHWSQWSPWGTASIRGEEIALPLWWDGAPVRDGIFRAWDAWGPDEDAAEFEATGWTTYDVLTEAMDATGGAEWLALSLERQGLCRVVLLDLVDGHLVERAP